MFLLPILLGAGIFYIFALTIHYSKGDSHLKPWGILSIMMWGNIIGIALTAIAGVAALMTHAFGAPSADTITSLTGLFFFVWLGYGGASAVTLYRNTG